MQRLNNYRDLVKAVIDDVAHDKIQAYEVMQVAGKTGANLKSDDSLLRQRRDWAAGLKEKNECRQQIKNAQRKMAKLENERQAAFKKYIDVIDNKMSLLQREVDVWDATIQQHWLSLKHLQDTAPNHIRAKLHALQAEFNAITAPKADLKKQAAASPPLLSLTHRLTPFRDHRIPSRGDRHSTLPPVPLGLKHYSSRASSTQRIVHVVFPSSL